MQEVGLKAVYEGKSEEVSLFRIFIGLLFLASGVVKDSFCEDLVAVLTSKLGT